MTHAPDPSATAPTAPTTPTADAASRADRSRTDRRAQRRTVLMCRPEHFAVDYVINPWMDPSRPVDVDLALAQWQALHDTYVRLGHEVRLIDPVPGLPDMVYAANGGFTLDGLAYGARFTYPERQAEGPAYLEWFRGAGFRAVDAEEVNEGEGDLLLVGDVVLAGTGFRTDPRAHDELARLTGREVVGLTLVDPRFYHLDTAMAVLDRDPVDGTVGVAYVEAAFDERSLGVLRERFPDALVVADEDAAVLGLNSWSDGRHVVISQAARGFERQLRERGYEPVPLDLSELLKGGGGVKCCTLDLRP